MLAELLTGFHHLTKLECKRDTRDIDKRSSLMNMNETDSDDEIEQSVPVTLRPPCNPDSNAYKKRARFTAWAKDPELLATEIKQTTNAMHFLRGELDRLQIEEMRWLTSFEMGRNQLRSSLSRNREYNAQLSREMKHLYALALAECGPSTRKRRNLCMRDCLEELQVRQVTLQARIAEYDRLAYDALSALAEKEGKSASDAAFGLAKGIPVTRLSISESALLDYPCDKVLYFPEPTKRNTDVLTIAENPEAIAAAKALRASVEQQKADETQAQLQLQQSAEQRDLIYMLDIQRGSSLAAVAGAAGAANAAAAAARSNTTGTEEEKQTRLSRSREAKAKEGGSAAMAVTEAASEDVIVSNNGEQDPSRELASLFSAVEESITFARANLGDVDVFFNDEFSSADDKLRVAAARVNAGAANAAGVPPSSPRSPRGGNAVSLVDDVIRDAGSRDFSTDLVYAVKDLSNALVPDSFKAGTLIAPLKNLRGELECAKHLDSLVNTVDGRGDNTRRKRRAQTTVHLQTFAYPRTPRGIPLLVSPLSQFEDRYLGSLYGGPVGSSMWNGSLNRGENTCHSLPRATTLVPAEIVREENRVMTHCMLQSASATSEAKIRRLRSSILEVSKQKEASEIALARAHQVYVHTLLEDTLESKRIRRELQSCGIGVYPATDLSLPMSPLAETSGWNSLTQGRNGTAAALAARGVWGQKKAKKAAAVISSSSSNGVPLEVQRQLQLPFNNSGASIASRTETSQTVSLQAVSTDNNMSRVQKIVNEDELGYDGSASQERAFSLASGGHDMDSKMEPVENGEINNHATALANTSNADDESDMQPKKKSRPTAAVTAGSGGALSTKSKIKTTKV